MMDKSLLATINDLKRKMSGCRPLNATEVMELHKQFVVENTYNSNAIEGNTITLRETAMIIQGGITIGGKSIQEHLDIVGHKDAIEYVYSLADDKRELSEFTIKEIHSLVLAADSANKGVYRRLPVAVGGHQPPEPALVPQMMEGMVDEYARRKMSSHPVEAAAWLHLQFENIHPFIDGNGRTGRLLLNFELLKSGLLPIDIKFSDKESYYRCFEAFDRQKDAAPMVNLVAKYEIQALDKYIQMLPLQQPVQGR